MAAVDTSQDIDSLLAQADSLMNDVAENVGASSAASPPTSPAPAAAPANTAAASSEAATTPPASTPAAPTDKAAINQIADGLAAAVEAVDHDAIIERLDAEHPSEAAKPAPVETPAQPEAAVPPANPEDAGPKPAPAEWLAEANLTDDTAKDQQLPQIPDVRQPARTAGPTAVGDSQAPPRPGPFSRCVRGVFRLPLNVLILLDLPFSGLGMTIKSCIGYAAIATLLTAAGTAIVGTMLHKS